MTDFQLTDLAIHLLKTAVTERSLLCKNDDDDDDDVCTALIREKYEEVKERTIASKKRRE